MHALPLLFLGPFLGAQSKQEETRGRVDDGRCIASPPSYQCCVGRRLHNKLSVSLRPPSPPPSSPPVPSWRVLSAAYRPIGIA